MDSREWNGYLSDLGMGDSAPGVGVRMKGELGSSGMSGSLGGTEGERLQQKREKENETKNAQLAA